MKVDLSAFEVWEHLNSEIATELQTPEEVTVRSYPGLPAAVFELVQSTAQFYSHKRSVALVGGQTPHVQSILPYLYKEGYEVQIAPADFSQTEWLASLKKDTCFAIVSEDHPVTGELYQVEEIEKFLNEKKIFCFRISHHNHLYRSLNLMPYSARICSYDPQTAVVLMGARQKAPALLAPFLSWNEAQFLKSLRDVRRSSKENRALVEAFESQLPKGFQKLLDHPNRCFDRALIYSEQAGGEALQLFLASKLNVSLGTPSWETEIETTHLCRWGGIKNYDLWWNPRPVESILRGLLILSTDILEHPDLKLTLQKALQECQIAEFN
jgi:hypothetical protein